MRIALLRDVMSALPMTNARKLVVVVFNINGFPQDAFISLVTRMVPLCDLLVTL